MTREHYFKRIRQMEKDDKQNSAQPSPDNGYAQRQSARGMLTHRIAMLRQSANELEILSDALPVKLPPAADAALWNILCNQPRI